MIRIPQNPYLIYGDANSAVSAANQTTGETQNITPQNNNYIVDCANFTSGYSNGDTILLIASGYSPQISIIDTVNFPDGKQVNFLTIYSTPAKIASLLRLINTSTQARKIFDDTTDPTLSEVENYIFEAEDAIDKETNHAWRTTYICNEYHNIGRPYTGAYRRELPVKLKHRSIQQFVSATDKIELWDGNNWVDLVLAANGYTEGRNQDFWVDYTNGIIYFISQKPYYAEKGVRVTYRYGETTVPYDIQEAATKLAACKILENDDYKVVVPDGLNPQFGVMSKVESWKKDIEKSISNHREVS